MIRHVIFIKIGDKSKAEEIKSTLESLPPQIPEIKRYDVGINEIESDRACDVCIISEFDNYETLKIYNDHPAHVKALGVIRQYATNVYAVDYTLPS